MKRLELKLDESRRLQEEKEKAKPHFLVRPGSPTADDQVCARSGKTAVVFNRGGGKVSPIVCRNMNICVFSF